MAEELGPPQVGRNPPLIEIARQDAGRGDGGVGHLATGIPAPRFCCGGPPMLADGMRGPELILYRIWINSACPGDQRPPQEELIADYSLWPR